MMQVEYKLKLGQDEFVLKAEVKDEKDFFEQMSFYSNLPKTAPNGATDLKLVFRTTKKGHKYYSLISEKEKKEFKLGQNLEANGGGLFPKGWDELYIGNDDQEQSQNQNVSTGFQVAPSIANPGYAAAPAVQQPIGVPQQAFPAFNIGGAPMSQPANGTVPIQQVQPTLSPFNPQFPGLVNPNIGPTSVAVAPPVQVAPQVFVPQTAAPVAPTPVTPPPQITKTANDVLARFGINK